MMQKVDGMMVRVVPQTLRLVQAMSSGTNQGYVRAFMRAAMAELEYARVEMIGKTSGRDFTMELERLKTISRAYGVRDSDILLHHFGGLTAKVVMAYAVGQGMAVDPEDCREVRCDDVDHVITPEEIAIEFDRDGMVDGEELEVKEVNEADVIIDEDDVKVDETSEESVSSLVSSGDISDEVTEQENDAVEGILMIGRVTKGDELVTGVVAPIVDDTRPVVVDESSEMRGVSGASNEVAISVVSLDPGETNMFANGSSGFGRVTIATQTDLPRLDFETYGKTQQRVVLSGKLENLQDHVISDYIDGAVSDDILRTFQRRVFTNPYVDLQLMIDPGALEERSTRCSEVEVIDNGEESTRVEVVVKRVEPMIRDFFPMSLTTALQRCGKVSVVKLFTDSVVYGINQCSAKIPMVNNPKEVFAQANDVVYSPGVGALRDENVSCGPCVSDEGVEACRLFQRRVCCNFPEFEGYLLKLLRYDTSGYMKWRIRGYTSLLKDMASSVDSFERLVIGLLTSDIDLSQIDHSALIKLAAVLSFFWNQRCSGYGKKLFAFNRRVLFKSGNSAWLLDLFIKKICELRVCGLSFDAINRVEELTYVRDCNIRRVVMYGVYDGASYVGGGFGVSRAIVTGPLFRALSRRLTIRDRWMQTIETEFCLNIEAGIGVSFANVLHNNSIRVYNAGESVYVLMLGNMGQTLVFGPYNTVDVNHEAFSVLNLPTMMGDRGCPVVGLDGCILGALMFASVMGHTYVLKVLNLI